MKSTGEVMGFDKDFGIAYAKSQISAYNSLPTKGLAFRSSLSEYKIIAVSPKLSDSPFGILCITRMIVR